MIKREFIREIAEETGFTQNDVGKVIDAMRGVVANIVRNQDKVAIFEGLIVEGVMVDETVKSHPVTKEPISIPKHIKAKARFAPSFKNEVR